MRSISQYILVSFLLIFPFVALPQTQEFSNKLRDKISDWNYFPIPKVGTQHSFTSFSLQGEITGKWVDEITGVENEKDATLVTITTNDSLFITKKTIKYDYVNNEIKKVKVVYPTGPKDVNEILVRLPLTLGQKWKCRPGALVYDSVIGFEEVTLAGNKYKCVVIGIAHVGIEPGSAGLQSRRYYVEGLGEIGSAYIINGTLIWAYKRTDISIENPKSNTTQKSSRKSIFRKELTDAIDNRDSKKAISLLSEEIPFESNNDTLYFYRAMCHSNLNEFSRAIKDVNKAIEINNSVAEYYNLRGLIRFNMIRSGHKSSNINKELYDDLLKIIKLDPNNAWAHITLGYFYFITKNYIHTYSSFKMAYKLSPKELKRFLNADTTYYLMSGIGLLAMNKSSEAIKKFELLENDKEKKAVSYFYRGMAYWELKYYEYAIRFFTLAIQNGVELNGEEYFFRASVYFNMHKYKEAIVDLRRVLTINPKNVVASALLKNIEDMETK